MVHKTTPTPLDNTSTRERIIRASARLFALHGVGGVSMRDIAAAVHITAGSIYNHFHSKYSILNAIFQKCEASFEACYAAIARKNKTAATLEDVIDNIFTQLALDGGELVLHGLVIAISQQYAYSTAWDLLQNYLVEGGRKKLVAELDAAIARGLCPPFDTDTAAVMILDSIFVSQLLRLGQTEAGHKTVNVQKQLQAISGFIARAAQNSC